MFLEILDCKITIVSVGDSVLHSPS